jgi:membrane fusion protein, multidrug efflux system
MNLIDSESGDDMMPSGNRPGTCGRFNTGSPVLLMGMLILLFVWSCGKTEKPAPPPPATVEVVEVIQKDVPIFAEWVATLDGVVNATIRAQVTGYLIKQNYKEGDLVKKGQVLFEIDPRPFQAALDQAQGDLAQKEARYTTAKANLTRIRPLAEKNAVSQKDLDDAVGMEQSARAAVEASKATVDKSRLDLGFTKISSPVDGIAGIAKAQIGNLVGPGQAEELTTVSTVDPIKAYSSLSEQEYMWAAKEKSTRAGKIPLELILTDGSVWPHKGDFLLADRQVDVRTGTIRVALTFPNSQNLLRPGMFSRVRAEKGIRKAARLIPQRAVSEVQGKYLVAVVSPDNKVAIKQVKVGERFGQLWIIEEGLKTGEKVVAEGTQKVREDMVVSPKPFVGDQPGPVAAQNPEFKPEAKPQPKPEKR